MSKVEQDLDSGAAALETADGSFRYRVESTTVVGPGDLRGLDASSGRDLTLITCFPFTYVGSGPNRFIVREREARPGQDSVAGL